MSDKYQPSKNIDKLILDELGRDIDENVEEARIRIDISHHQIHEGKMFALEAVNISMADTETLIIAFKTGALKCHVVVDYDTKVGGHVEILSGATWTSTTGTTIIPHNKDYNSSNVSSILGDKTGSFVANNALQDPTGISGGIHKHLDYSFGSKQIGAGKTRELHEDVFEPNTNYVIKYTADGATNAGFLKLLWYEV